MGEHRPRWRALAIGLLVLALLTVMYVTSQPREGLTAGERFLRDMLAPVETAFSSVTHRVRGTAERFRSWRALQEQNEALRQEVVALRIRNQMLEEAWRENQVLRAMVGLVQEGGHPLVTGLVIGRPVSNWWSQVTINRGRRDGVAPRMPVVTADGAVGWVLSVSERTAEVMLLVDARSAVGAMVQRTGVPVVVEGAASEGIPRLRLRALVAGADLRVGDVVVTSGFSQIFPTGVRVGRIAEVLPTPSGRAAEAWLEPAVDFSRLEMVGVLLSPEGAPGAGGAGTVPPGLAVPPAPPSEAGPAADGPAAPPAGGAAGDPAAGAEGGR